MRHTPVLVAMLLTVGTALASEPSRRVLTFEDRVAAQKAIEQVYWNHRIWPHENPGSKPPLSAVMSDAAIRAKVVDYLKMSNALETWWQRPVTGEQLQAELDRMAVNSHDPDTLSELFAALGNDPFVIAETLARPMLVDRLIHGWYANDDRLHGDLKRRAEAALASCRSAGCMRSMGGRYVETNWTFRGDPPDPNAIVLDADEWKDHLDSLGRKFDTPLDSLPAGRLSRLEETEDSFEVISVLARGRDAIATAAVIWQKTPFDTWWAAARITQDANVRSPAGAFTLTWPGSGGCVNDTWKQIASLDPRINHTAVWTGTEMIIWGGFRVKALSTGGRYNPATDSWSLFANGTSTPVGRYDHTAVWTGTEMIVWGGHYQVGGVAVYLNSGARYDPSTNVWTATSAGVNVPSARRKHTAIWTGSEMVVWGGSGAGGNLATGGRYSPSSDSWVSTSMGPNVPLARVDHTAVWTGSKMIVWGGIGAGYFNDGGRYDPSTDSWTTVSVGPNVPTGRQFHTAVWTGTRMIVWGGLNTTLPDPYLNSGALYDPLGDSWIPTSVGSAPVARYYHSAIWTGTEMIIWGGSVRDILPGCTPSWNCNIQVNSGGRYNPSTNSWTPTPTGANVPAARRQHTAIWTGTEIIVWGGYVPLPCSGPCGSVQDTYRRDGGRYNPVSNSWVATSRPDSAPTARLFHVAIWTGAEMIVWGGRSDNFAYLNTGSRYDPPTDTWIATPTGPNVPAGRQTHTAVWTGTEMIVWGGYYNDGFDRFVNSGGRYSPSSNTWATTSTGPNVPTGRDSHTAVWTGTEMIVWGGRYYPGGQYAYLNTGGRYNPSTNSWLATSLGAGVPSVRDYHAAVWTGTEMIVWGGTTSTVSDVLNTGGRYNPATDSWTATSTGANVPAARYGPVAVWTGTAMIVWGGAGDSNNELNTGARYHPSANSWLATSTGPGAPTARYSPSAVWTGNEMIVWGGYHQSSALPAEDTGGRYNPSTDSWAATSTGLNTPTGRSGHSALWTGSEMLIWGGSPNGGDSGGVYCACPGGVLYHRDADGDGHGTPSVAHSSCDGSIPAGYVADDTDCDDTNPSIHPGAAESCNGIDDNCNGLVDGGIPAPLGIPALTVTSAAGSATLSWTAASDVTSYDVVKGSLSGLRASLGNFTTSTTSCVGNDLSATTVQDAEVPAVGDGLWYVVRPVNSCGGPGTYDEGTVSQVHGRDAGINASPSACP